MKKRILLKHKPLYTMHKPQEQYCGQKWEFHLTDADGIFPSILHAHAADKPWKLDGVGGGIYDIHTKKLIDKLSRKELNALHRNKQFCDFARRRYEWYNQQHANETMQVPEWAKCGTVAFLRLWPKHSSDSFVFFRKAYSNRTYKGY